MKNSGTVDAIHLAPASGADVHAVNEVEAVAECGLRGDRHFQRPGTVSEARNDRALTLIEAEAVEAIEREADIHLAPGAHRRNVTTRDTALNHLVCETFRVGDAVCRGAMLCEPCSHLQSLTVEGVLGALVHRGGLCAEIIESGTISSGDPITVLDDP